MYKEISQCPISGDKEHITYIDLGDMPLVNNLNNTREESLSCPRVPLKVNFYPKSQLSMLSNVVDPNILFSHYVYKSGTSEPYLLHCRKMFHYINRWSTMTLEPHDTIVDIGGNDGTLLSVFLKESPDLMAWNVDPSDVVDISTEKGNIKPLKAMWGSANPFNRNCKIITSTNVFQHLENIDDFVKGISKALHDKGIWCLEFPYWKTSLETNQFDQVYHEHIYYYLLTPLNSLFQKYGLEIIDVSHHAIHGGTLRIISKKKIGVSHANLSVMETLNSEKHLTTDYYLEFGRKLKSDNVGKKQLIYYLNHEGKKVAAFGAAAKGCIFLNACNIDYKFINYIVDDTDTKQGKFMPGTGIEIVSREKLISDPPDYLLILAHNFADYITKSLRPIYKGKFIVMFPEIKIYE